MRVYAHRASVGGFFAPFEYRALIFCNTSSMVGHKGGGLGVVLRNDCDVASLRT